MTEESVTKRKVEDNPSWPNSSAEDSRKDEAAGLPIPTVKDHIWVLSSQDVECLAIGTGILGSGGGGDPKIGRLMAMQLLKQGKEIKIFNPFRMQSSKMGLLCAMALMGAPTLVDEKLVTSIETMTALKLVTSIETMTALRQLEKALASGVCEVDEGKSGNEKVAVTCRTLSTGEKVWVADEADLKKIDIGPTIPLNRRITSLICVETGGINSFVPLLVAAHTGLPALDVDGMGRAFPELQMFAPFIYGLKAYPGAVADDKEESIVCTHADGAKILEEFFRKETVRMGVLTGVAFGVMTMSEMMNKCILFAMSQAWQLGRAVLRAQRTQTNVLDTITEQRKGIILITGKVQSVDHTTEGGFTRLVVVVEGLEDYAGALIRICTKNENYIAQEVKKSGTELVDGVVLACTPDIICVVHSDTGYPITTETISCGMLVGVLALPANPMLLTPEALAVVGPQAFALDIPYTPPRPLPKGSN